MRQIALKTRLGALLGHKHSPEDIRSSRELTHVEWWRRWFLPSDFWSQVELCSRDSVHCRKFLTEYLSVRERRKFATVRVCDTQNYRREPDYHPEDFRNQRVTLIENEERISCGPCKGQGTIDCSPEMPCPNCKGRRTRKDYCFSCGGSGRSGAEGKEVCWPCGGRGIRSEGCAACADVYSSSTGRVRCGRCGGAAWVLCRRCAGAGAKVRANLIFRKYSLSTEVHYRMGGLEGGKFRYGLAPRHFRSLPGKLVKRETLTGASATAPVQRVSEFSYGVEVRTFRYKGSEFHLNRIDSNGGAGRVWSNLPWSSPRLAFAGALSAVAVTLVAAFLLAA